MLIDMFIKRTKSYFLICLDFLRKIPYNLNHNVIESA